MRSALRIAILPLVCVAFLMPLPSAYGRGTQRPGAMDVGELPPAKLAPFFPIGVFEDASATNTPAKLTALVDTLQTRGFDSVLFTNSFSDRQASILDVSDKRLSTSS